MKAYQPYKVSIWTFSNKAEFSLNFFPELVKLQSLVVYDVKTLDQNFHIEPRQVWVNNLANYIYNALLYNSFHFYDLQEEIIDPYSRQ